jgi:hypothetical protein
MRGDKGFHDCRDTEFPCPTRFHESGLAQGPGKCRGPADFDRAWARLAMRADIDEGQEFFRVEK